MDISFFCDLLYAEMVNLGADEAKVARYIDNLRKNLTSEDIANITEDAIPGYARVCVNSMRRSAPVVSATPDEAYEKEDSSDELPRDEDIPRRRHQTPAYTPGSVPHHTMEVHTPEKTDSSYEEYADSSYDAEKKVTAKFILVSVATSPLWLIAAVLFLLPFALIFAAEIALILAFILLLAGCAALGTAAALTGIIYGVIQTFSVPSVGVYEIGFGIIIGGVSLVCGILLYNGAVRLMPWIMKKSGQLFRMAFAKVKPLLAEYKRRLTV